MLNKMHLSEEKKVHPSPTSLPSVYTKPSDDKEIDVFTCLECNQVYWNRERTLEHIYKEHAQGAVTYKARYMVKRIKNSKAYNLRKQIVCMLCYFLIPNTDPNSYLEHLTGHYMTLHKCVHCEQNFSSREALNKHKNAHKKDIIMCKICDQSMPLQLYAEHQRTHSWYARTQPVNAKKILDSKGRLKGCSEINNGEKKKKVMILKNLNTISGTQTPVETDMEEVVCEGEVKEDGKRCEDNEHSG